MPTPKYMWGIKGDECQCGRRSTVRHCPSCGSAVIYGFAQPRLIEKPGPNGTVVYDKAQMYRCRVCATTFTDPEREFCGAPPVGAALARLRIQNLHEAKKSGESMTPTEEKMAKAVNDLLGDVHEQALPSDEEAYREFKIVESQLLQMYNEEVFKYKQEGKDHPETADEFVSKMMTMHGIKRVEKPKKEGE